MCINDDNYKVLPHRAAVRILNEILYLENIQELHRVALNKS